MPAACSRWRAAALLLAVLTRRPELAGVAGAAAAAARRGRAPRPSPAAGCPRRPDAARRHAVGLASSRACTRASRPAVDAGRATTTRYDARWALEPGRGIEPGSATAVNGAAARFTFTVPRWGKRQLGTVTLVLHDPLAAGRRPGRASPSRPWTATRPRPCSAPRWCSAGCRTASASTAARVPGDGTEFTGVREFVPGDRQRAINWPASTRLRPPPGEHVRRRALPGRGAARGRDLGRRPARRRPRSTWGCAARRARPAPTWTAGTGWA